MQGSKLRSTSIRSKSGKQDLSQFKGPSLQIIPSEVVFKDVEVDQYYEITIEIRNLTHRAKRIRIEQCSNPDFSVLYTMQPEIAPGLSTTAKIKYLCKQLKNETEFIKVLSDDGPPLELPVRVYKTQSQIIFEPFVNMGFVKCGKEHSEVLTVKNVGKAQGAIEFTHNHPGTLTVNPSKLTVEPKQEAKVSINFKTVDAGLFKGEISLSSESILVKDKIDIHATAVEFARYVVDSKGAQNSLFDFRNLYNGQESVLKGFIINNSPKKMSFKSTFRKGYLVSAEEFALVQTPAEIGAQQSDRIMFMEPEYGTIQAFGECEVRFICRTQASYKDKVFTKTFALTSAEEEAVIHSKKNSSEYRPENLHEYSVMMGLEDDEPIIVQLRAQTSCPQVKVEKDLFQFGDCLIKETRQLAFWVENKSNVSKAEISFQKIPNFSVYPSSYCLRPLEKMELRIQFEPKTIGKFDVIQKLLLNRIYEVELRLFGIATHQPKSAKKIKELAGEKKFEPINTRVKAFSVAERSFVSEMRVPTHEAEKSKLELSNLHENREKFNKYLNERRSDRSGKQKATAVQKRWSLYQAKLKDLNPGKLEQENQDEEGNSTNPPIDYEFESGMNDTKIGRPQIALPAVSERLFVTKHINDYEPLSETSKREQFVRSLTDAPRSLLPEKPVNYNHRREITAELSPQELSQIEVMTNSVEFGDVYIKSREARYFWVRNSTKKAVSIELKFSAPELSKSYKKPQVLKSGEETGFEIIFCKDTLGDFKGSGKYIINGVHEFEMSVSAKSTPVEVNLSSTELKFSFSEKSLEFETERELTLYNPGNSSAYFKFLQSKERMFIPKIQEGTLDSKKTLKVPITFKVPSPVTRKNEYHYTQRLVLKVLDGVESPILCSYSASEPKFSVKCEKLVSKPIICLGHSFEDTLDIKNQSKANLVLSIESTNNFEIFPNKLLLSPEESKKISLKFLAKIIGQFNVSISLTPRGGQKRVIESTIKVTEPQIKFSSEYIEMGTLIVQGVAGQGTLTLESKNEIPLPLIIDMRPKTINQENPRFVDLVTLKLQDSEQSLEVIAPQRNAIEQLAVEGENLVGRDVDEEEFENSESEDEVIPQRNEEEYRKYRLMVLPGKSYRFSLEFYPSEVDRYQIELPMAVEDSIKIENSPIILAQAIKPQFIFEPSIIDFKRKIVTRPDRCYPKFVTVEVSNIDDDEVTWSLQDEEIKKDGIFEIAQNGGVIGPKQKVELKVSFNPFAVGEYFYKLPLFIKSGKLKEPLKYVDVVMKGTASLPNLFFNKREVILPVVPLGVETCASFRVINDGYENCNLKHGFVDDIAGIGVRVHFPEGPSVGITRQKLKVDLSWKFPKPMSFCLKLEFTDDMNRSFAIPVSGTADNCIFTNYTYFLRNEGRFRIKSDSSLQLVETPDNSSSTFSLKRKNSAHSFKSNATGKSVMSYLGVSPIDAATLANTLNYVNRYLNANLLTAPITEFPESLIDHDGHQLFEIIAFVSNKGSNYPWKYNGGLKGLDKALKLFEQYSELIKMLKIEGAHLNHIRPEYLLSFTDLNLYLGSLPEEKAQFLIPSLLKINRSLYNYLSIESWITLLYQIFKIYVLSRVTPKNFKTHVSNAPEVPKLYLEQSNFSSTHENILFFWVEQAISEVLLEERRLTNFDKDFKDGVAIGALLKKYANNEVLKKMKMICSSKEDYESNAETLCEALREIGLLNHVVPRDIYSPLQREMLLFVLHLYVYLPFYVPKQEPIAFRCILGEEVIRSIELTNPSSQAVNYEAKFEGSGDFVLLSDSRIRLEPKETFKFEVKFVSRVSSPVHGRILFVNVKENSLTAAPLVFDLKSEITGKISDRVWNISGVLYEQVEFSIEVGNKYAGGEMVDFAISYETEYIFDQSKQKGGKSPAPPLPREEQAPTIYGKVDSVKIRRNGSTAITLNYIPSSLYTTRTVVYFVNPTVGEFQHEIIGTVEPPSVSAEIRPPMALTVDQVVNWQYLLNPKNDMVARCKKSIDSILKKKKSQKPTDGNKDKKAPTEAASINEEFVVEISPNPFLSAKETIWINEKTAPNPNQKPPKEKDSKNDTKKEPINETRKSVVDSENRIPITILCKNPVYEYSNFILVYNRSRTDVRRYRIVFTVQPKPLRAVLEMNVPARGEVTQNLPIVNNTDKDWVIKIQWQPDASKFGNYFSVASQYASSFPVKRQSIGNFPITFRPKWTNRAEARLTMSNPLTLDHFEYDIIGNGEDPLAEDHLEIKCQAKEKVSQEILVKNPYSDRPVTFRVETDLLNCEAPATVTVPAAGKEKVKISVQPMLCGEYTGSITLFEEDSTNGQYLWYTISVVTNYPEAYKELTLKTEIRSKVVEKLFLPYSSDSDQERVFQVIINGSGLSGPAEVTLSPHQENYYYLEYMPLEVAEERGSVIFINSDAGEILYEFVLGCVPKPPVVVNDIKSPLGVSQTILAELENPLGKKVVVNVFNSNPEQFALKSPLVKLQPYEKKSVEIEYIPASLDKIESAVVVFKSQEVGEWIYELSGMGQSPVPFEPKTVFNGVFEEHSDSLKFKNPFKYEIMVGLKLLPRSNRDANIFKLLNSHRSKFEIESFGVLEIPFSFIPPACERYHCDVLVMISEKIFWTFPIVGVTEVNKGESIAHLTSQCRLSVSQYAQVQLEGVENFKENNKYELTLENVPAFYQKLIDRSLVVDFRKNSLSHSNDSLELEFSFKPMKPIKVSFDLLITRKEGSRWRYKVTLEGTEPEPDDHIEIESNLLVTSTVSFKMTNWEKATVPFKAKFTSDSAHEFSVESKEGTLSKYGGKGTAFYVSFTPVEYGKEKRGKLIIQTSDMYWSYVLKGSLPKYVPPKNQAVRSRILSTKK